jgi:hypothetical protein
MTRDEAIKLTVKSLLEVVQTGAKNIEISVMESYGKVTVRPSIGLLGIASGTNIQIQMLRTSILRRWRGSSQILSGRRKQVRALSPNQSISTHYMLMAEAERKRSRVAATAASQAAMATGISSGSAPPSGPVTGTNTPRPGA